jgi:hypothetical protein
LRGCQRIAVWWSLLMREDITTLHVMTPTRMNKTVLAHFKATIQIKLNYGYLFCNSTWLCIFSRIAYPTLHDFICKIKIIEKLSCIARLEELSPQGRATKRKHIVVKRRFVSLCQNQAHNEDACKCAIDEGRVLSSRIMLWMLCKVVTCWW